MVQKTPLAVRDEKDASHLRAHILFIEARFYEDIADMLVEGAIAECAKRGVTLRAYRRSWCARNSAGSGRGCGGACGRPTDIRRRGCARMRHSR